MVGSCCLSVGSGGKLRLEELREAFASSYNGSNRFGVANVDFGVEQETPVEDCAILLFDLLMLLFLLLGLLAPVLL